MGGNEWMYFYLPRLGRVWVIGGHTLHAHTQSNSTKIESANFQKSYMIAHKKKGTFWASGWLKPVIMMLDLENGCF